MSHSGPPVVAGVAFDIGNCWRLPAARPAVVINRRTVHFSRRRSLAVTSVLLVLAKSRVPLQAVSKAEADLPKCHITPQREDEA